MKKLILLIILPLILIACNFDEYNLEDDRNIKVKALENYTFDNNIIEEYNIKNLYDSMKWVAFNTSYFPDGKHKDYAQTPKETYNRRNDKGKMIGDCEDHCLILGYLAKEINLTTDILLCYAVRESEIAGEDKYHTIVYCHEEDVFIESVTGNYINYEDVKEFYPIIYTIPYEEYLWMAYHYHRLVGKYIL